MFSCGTGILPIPSIVGAKSAAIKLLKSLSYIDNILTKELSRLLAKVINFKNFSQMNTDKHRCKNSSKVKLIAGDKEIESFAATFNA